VVVVVVVVVVGVGVGVVDVVVEMVLVVVVVLVVPPVEQTPIKDVPKATQLFSLMLAGLGEPLQSVERNSIKLMLPKLQDVAYIEEKPKEL
jgi:hypothetical protein